MPADLPKQQPLIPAGGGDMRHGRRHQQPRLHDAQPRPGDNHNANVFADCYGRMGDIIPELVREGRNPRVMLDYSGELLYGLRKMGRGDVLDRLRGITCDPHLRKYVEWLGTMWGHAVASSTPLPDLKLHMRAWQQQLRGRLRLGGPGPGARLLAAGDAPAQPPRRRLRVRQGAQGVRLPVAAGAGAHGRNAGGPRPRATSTCRTG